MILKTIIAIMITSAVYGQHIDSIKNSYDYMLKKDLKNSIIQANKNINNLSYSLHNRLLEFMNLGHYYILIRKLNKAKFSYSQCITIVKYDDFISDYKLMLKLYPDKKILLSKGLSVIEDLYKKASFWDKYKQVNTQTKKRLTFADMNGRNNNNNRENNNNLNIINEWKNAGVLTPQKAKEWKQLGVADIYKIPFWKNLGIYTILEATQWHEYDIEHGIENTEEWIRSGIKSPKKISKLKKIGIEYPSTYSNWNDIGLTEPKEISSWINVGTNFNAPTFIEPWLKIGIRNPKEAKKWREIVDTAERADKWIKVGITDPNIVEKWEQAGVNPAQVKNIDITLKEIKNWNEVGVEKASDINRLKRLGIATPKEVKKWLKIGVDSIDEIEGAITIGFNNPKDYKPYKGIKLEYTKKLKKWGIKPNKLIKSMVNSDKYFGKNINLYFKNKNSFTSKYNELHKYCKVINQKPLFSSTDEYSNKNECYIFWASMQQRLDKHGGLAKGLLSKKLFLVKLKDNWQNNKSRFGIILGDGAFSYKTTLGYKNTVPKGKIIFSEKID